MQLNLDGECCIAKEEMMKQLRLFIAGEQEGAHSADEDSPERVEDNKDCSISKEL